MGAEPSRGCRDCQTGTDGPVNERLLASFSVMDPQNTFNKNVYIG